MNARLLLAASCLLAMAGCDDRPGGAAAPGANNPARGAAGQAVAAEPGAGANNPELDWPKWRGPRSDGISRESRWRGGGWPKEGPKQLWSEEIGVGFSSVSVADGRLYTMGHADDDDTVFCLNPATGKDIWKFSYPCALVDNLNEGGPACTPTVDGNRVYTISKEGHLYCFDTTAGDIIWSAELQRVAGVKMPEWGFSCSPLVVDDRLIVEAGSVVAFNKSNGDFLWKTKAYKPGYGSPALMRNSEHDLICVLNNECVLLVETEDGDEICTYAWKTDFDTSATTPIVVDQSVFISTGYQRGCTLLDLKAGKFEPRYENKHMRNHMNNCVLYEGTLYGFDGNSHVPRLVALSAIDFETGEPRWSERGLGCGSLMIADGKLIVLSDEGELLIAPATPEGFKPTARAKVTDGKCWTTPVLSHGRIYVRNVSDDEGGKLVCLDVSKS